MPNVVRFSAILTMEARQFLGALSEAQAKTDQLAVRVSRLGQVRGPGILTRAVGRLGRALRDIMVIAIGINLASIFWRARAAVGEFFRASLEATAVLQALELQIRGLQAREMAGFINSAVEAATIYREDLKDGVSAVTIDTVKLREALGDQVTTLRTLNPQLAAVLDTEKRYASIKARTNDLTLTGNELFGLSADRAAATVNELRRMAIISPLSVQTTMDLFRLASAFQFNTEQSMRMTRGMLNVAAGLGATTEQTQRMMFNFAQIRMQGKIMARDFWELGKAGFDLYGVLKELSKQMGYNIKTHLDFNALIKSGKVTWEDFVVAFESMAEKQFGGAAKRMAFTLMGLKSTIKDVFILTVPELLKPTIEIIGRYAEEAVDKLLEFAESGKMRDAGEKLARSVVAILSMFGLRLPPPEIPEPADAEERGLLAAERYMSGFGEEAEKLLPEKLAAVWAGFQAGGLPVALDTATLEGLISPEMAQGIQDLADGFNSLADALGRLTADVFGPVVKFFQGLGGALSDADIPTILSRVGDALGAVGDYLDEHPHLADALRWTGYALLTIAAAEAAVSVLTSVGAAVAGLGTALLANPLMLFILLGLVAAFAQIEKMGGVAKVLNDAAGAARALVGILLMFGTEVAARIYTGITGIFGILEQLVTKLADFLGWLSMLPGIDIPQELIDGIRDVADAFGSLSDKASETLGTIRDLQHNIPEWVIGHSPSPLAVGLQTAADAMRDLRRQAAPLARGFGRMPQPAMATAGPSKQVRIDSVVIQNQMDLVAFREMLRQTLS